MKKRMFVLAMVLVLSLLCSVSAFAAETETLYEADFDTPSSKDVTITINGEIVHVYKVDLEFVTPTFTYSTGSKWDPDNYQYVPSATATWAGEGSVKITNHSDQAVDYTVESEVTTTSYGPLNIKVSGQSGTIAKCKVGDAIGSHNVTSKWSVDGTPTVSEITEQRLGEIRVTISKSTTPDAIDTTVNPDPTPDPVTP